MRIEASQGQHCFVNEERQATSKITVRLGVVLAPNFRIVEKVLSRERRITGSHKNASAGVLPRDIKVPLRHKTTGELNSLHGALLVLLAVALFPFDCRKQVVTNASGNISCSCHIFFL